MLTSYSLGLIVLEAAANVLLPDNGLPWRKLRQDDLSDVALGHISDELLRVVMNLMRSDPSERTTINELQEHPIIARLQQLRDVGQHMEEASQGASPYRHVSHKLIMAKGAVIEESPDFLQAVLAEVRQRWYSPKSATLARPTKQSPAQSVASHDGMEVDL